MAHQLTSEERSAQDGQSSDRSLGELFSELTKETTDLVRKEVALAKTELSHKAAHVGKDVGFLAGGALVAYAGFLTLIAAVVLGLGNAIPLWLSALIVGAVVIAVGGALVYMGMNQLKRLDLAPKQTLETIKEDAQWAKQQTS